MPKKQPSGTLLSEFDTFVSIFAIEEAPDEEGEPVAYVKERGSYWAKKVSRQKFVKGGIISLGSNQHVLELLQATVNLGDYVRIGDKWYKVIDVVDENKVTVQAIVEEVLNAKVVIT